MKYDSSPSLYAKAKEICQACKLNDYKTKKTVSKTIWKLAETRNVKGVGKVPNHEKKDYLAKDVECGNCTYIGYYVVMCRTKYLKRHTEHEEEEEFTLGSANKSETVVSDCTGVVHDKEDLWHTRIMTLGKPAKYSMITDTEDKEDKNNPTGVTLNDGIDTDLQNNS